MNRQTGWIIFLTFAGIVLAIFAHDTLSEPRYSIMKETGVERPRYKIRIRHGWFLRWDVSVPFAGTQYFNSENKALSRLRNIMKYDREKRQRKWVVVDKHEVLEELINTPAKAMRVFNSLEDLTRSDED